jgi:hypothetical protein
MKSTLGLGRDFAHIGCGTMLRQMEDYTTFQIMDGNHYTHTKSSNKTSILWDGPPYATRANLVQCNSIQRVKTGNAQASGTLHQMIDPQPTPLWIIF